MKTTSISYPFILFACAILSPVFGSPTPNCGVGHACVELRDNPQELKSTALATIKYIKENVAEINKIPLSFDGGYTPIQGKDVQTWTKIADFQKVIQPAKIHDLEDVIKDAKQDYSGWEDADWRAVTGALAENASGLIYIILGEYIPGDSIFQTIELHEDGNINQSPFSASR